MQWEVLAEDAVALWLEGLNRADPKSFELVAAAIDKLGGRWQ